MGICPASEHTKVGDRGFATIEGFKGRFFEDSSGGGSVKGVEEAGECLSPKASREM